MATYAELGALRTDADLLARVVAATEIAAETVKTEGGDTANHADRLKWAQRVFSDPTKAGNEMLGAILAEKKTDTVTDIKASTDVVLQTAVDGAINFFAG